MTVSLPKYQYQNISVSDWLQSLGGFFITFFLYLETTEEQLTNVLKTTAWQSFEGYGNDIRQGWMHNSSYHTFFHLITVVHVNPVHP